MQTKEKHRIKNKKMAEVKPGDVVLIHDENAKHGMWKTGIIEETMMARMDNSEEQKYVRWEKVSQTLLIDHCRNLFQWKLQDKYARKERMGMKERKKREGTSRRRDSEWIMRRQALFGS